MVPTLLRTSLTTTLLFQLFAAVSSGRFVLHHTPANVQQVLLGPCVKLVSYTPIYYRAIWLKFFASIFHSSLPGL